MFFANDFICFAKDEAAIKAAEIFSAEISVRLGKSPVVTDNESEANIIFLLTKIFAVTAMRFQLMKKRL